MPMTKSPLMTKLREAADDVAGGGRPSLPCDEDQASSGDVEREPQDGGDQEDGRKGGESSGRWIHSATIRISTERAIERARPKSIRNGGIGRKRMAKDERRCATAKPMSRNGDFRRRGQTCGNRHRIGHLVPCPLSGPWACTPPGLKARRDPPVDFVGEGEDLRRR